MSESNETSKDVLVDAQEYANLLSYSLTDRDTIIRKVSEFLLEKFPERIGTAYWLDVKGNRDQGLTIDLHEKPITFRDKVSFKLAALLGFKTAGGAVFADLVPADGMKRRVTTSIGLGAVAPYGNLSDWRMVGVVRVSF